MQITQKKSRKKIIIPIVLLLAALIVGGVFWYQSTRPIGQNSNNQSKTDSDTSTPDPSKLDNSNDEQESTDQQKQDTVKNDQQEPTSSNDLTVTLTASGRNGDVYQLRYLIQQTLSDGICDLTLTQGATTVRKTASIQSLSSSSTCQGFDISTNELGSGTWQASLKVTSGSKSGTTSSEISL